MPTPSSRWTRLLISVLVGGALLLGAAYVLLAIAFPPQRLAGLLSEQVRQATGRSFTLQGDLSLRLLPRIGVDAGKLAFGNAAWGSRPDMLRVEQAQFDLALWPLLQGKVALDGARFRGVDLLLETDRNGVGNWVMTP
ncbi:MAG: AsmA family protein, partial [Burkholderiales bacterium]|nr:AsmA family protein [Burkholderiales bacterium]